MTTQEKFNAAVNVIKSLPKNGPYQPSYDLMLRFYAYYKQATQGPCRGARPAFWDVVGKAKYDAWKNLGDMTSESAMAKYVDELHTIVETMSFSDKVANFLNAPNDAQMDKVVMADLELIAGDVFEKVRSQNNSPLGSRDQSPQRMNGHSAGTETESPYPSGSDTEHSDGEYVDTIESPEPRKLIPNGTTHHIPLTNGYVTKDQKPARKHKSSQSVDISNEISIAVQSLRTDVEALGRKVTALEASRTVNVAQPRRKIWWRNTPPQLLVLMLVWPIVATFVLNKLMNRRKV